MAKTKKLPDDAKFQKKDGEEDEEDDEEEDEEEEKSLDLTDADLEKSLKMLGDLATAGDSTSRKDSLLSKAQKGDLATPERQELFDLLGGDKPAETMGTEIIKALKGNDTMQKALDVSDYLDAQQEELCKALGTMGDRIESSDSRQHTFNLVLAKALVETGKLVKSMSDRLGVVGAQPARGPMSRGVAAQPLSKSFADGQASEDQMSKGQILDTMLDMVEKSIDPSCGEDLVHAIAKYEQTNLVSQDLLTEVKAHRSQNAA